MMKNAAAAAAVDFSVYPSLFFSRFVVGCCFLFLKCRRLTNNNDK
jgi:hypothetical protein